MSDALYIAATGLKSVQHQLNNISNNIANLATNNYKRTVVNFEDVMYRNIQNTGAAEGIGTAIQSTKKDFSQGPLKVTQSASDVAIKGEGFYTVILENGQVAYTRSSKITRDNSGYLVTADGHRLSQNIQIPSDAQSYAITESGHVMVQVPDETEALDIGTIQLAKFINPNGLRPIGKGLYVTTKDSGEVYVDNPNSNGLGTLEQGMTEGSNVNIVQELTSLMLAQRVYEMNAQVAHVSDNLAKMTDNLREA